MSRNWFRPQRLSKERQYRVMLVIVLVIAAMIFAVDYGAVGFAVFFAAVVLCAIEAIRWKRTKK